MKHDSPTESNGAQNIAVAVTLMVVLSIVSLHLGLGQTELVRKSAAQQFRDAGKYGAAVDAGPHVRVTLAGESANVFSSVTNGFVGFSEIRIDGFWIRHRNDDGLVSLAGLPGRKHWLISGSASGRAVFPVTLPVEDSVVEARLRVLPARWADLDARPTFEPSSPRVEFVSDSVETIVVDVRNYGDGPLTLFESDVTLVLQQQRFRVYSPGVASNGATVVGLPERSDSLTELAEPAPLVTVPAGESRSIRIHWPLWVSKGIWTLRLGELITEPAFPAATRGKVQARVDVLNYGTLPVSLTEPGVVIKEQLVAFDDSDATQAEPTVTPSLLVRMLMLQVATDRLKRRADAIVQLGTMGKAAAPAASILVEQLARTDDKVTIGRGTSSTALHTEKALQSIGRPAAPALIAGLSHENTDVRTASARILGGMRFEPAVSILIERLGDKDRSVAGAASSALKNIGDAAFDQLLKVLVDGLNIPAPTKPWLDGEHPDPDDPLTLLRQQRNYAAGVLGKLNDSRAIEPLIDALDQDDRLFRRWAAVALSAMTSEECQAVISRRDIVLRLLGHLETDDRRQQNEMISILRHVAKDGREPLLAALKSQDRRMRVSLFRVWMSFRDDDDRIVPAILKRVGGTTDDERSLTEPLAIQERLSALNVVSGRMLREQNSPNPFLPILLGRLSDPSAQVRATAALRLADVPHEWKADPRVLPELLNAMEIRSDASTRSNVIYALSEIGDARSVMPLVSLFSQKEQFASQGDIPRDELNAEAVKQQDDDIRKRICDALIKLKDKRAIPALRSRRELNEPFVLEALGKLGDVDSLPTLLKQLVSESYDVRLSAAKALQGTPDPRAIKPLAGALKKASGGGFTNRNVSSKSQMARELSLALAATFEPEAAQILVASLRDSSLEMWEADSRTWYRPPLADAASRDPRSYAITRMGSVTVPFWVSELSLPRRESTVHLTEVAKQTGGVTSTKTSREVSVWAIAKLLLEDGLAPTDSAEAESTLIAALNVNEPALQLHTAKALGRLRSKPAIPAMLELLKTCRTNLGTVNDEDLAAFLRRASPFQPDQDGDAERQQVLVELLVAVTRSLTWTESNAYAVEMEQLLSHGAADVREAAIYGVVSGKHENAAELVVSMLDDPASKVRYTAARRLGFLGDARCVPALLQLLDSEARRPKPPAKQRRNGLIVFNPSEPDSRYRVMSMAAQSLGMLRNVEASDAIFELTHIDDTELHAHAVLAMVHLGDERGIDAFRHIVEGTDKKLRSSLLTRTRLLGWLSNNTSCPKFTVPTSQEMFRDLTTKRLFPCHSRKSGQHADRSVRRSNDFVSD